jgi:hypothetical protein
MNNLYYKGTRVSPSSTLGTMMLYLREMGPKLSDAARADLKIRIEKAHQECDAEYRKWGNK